MQGEFDWLYGTEHYEPAAGLYDVGNPDVASRLTNPPGGKSQHDLLEEDQRTWELLSKAEVETRLGYPVTELPRDNKWGDLDVVKVKQWVCIPATMEFTVWSDTHRCEGFITLEEPSVTAKGKTVMRKKRVPRGCGHEIVLWDAAVDRKTRGVLEVFACPQCEQKWKKGDIPRLRSVPVLTRYDAEDNREEGCHYARFNFFGSDRARYCVKAAYQLINDGLVSIVWPEDSTSCGRPPHQLAEGAPPWSEQISGTAGAQARRVRSCPATGGLDVARVLSAPAPQVGSGARR